MRDTKDPFTSDNGSGTSDASQQWNVICQTHHMSDVIVRQKSRSQTWYSSSMWDTKDPCMSDNVLVKRETIDPFMSTECCTSDTTCVTQGMTDICRTYFTIYVKRDSSMWDTRPLYVNGMSYVKRNVRQICQLDIRYAKRASSMRDTIDHLRQTMECRTLDVSSSMRDSMDPFVVCGPV